MLTWFEKFMSEGTKMMADGAIVGGDEEIEYIVVDPKEEEEGEGEGEKAVDDSTVPVSKEKYEEMVKQGNSADVLNQGLQNLAETLKGRGESSAAVPDQQRPGESDADFRERISKDLFEDGKTYGALTEVMQKEFGPVFNQLAAGTVKLQKKVLRNDPETGEYFKRYEKDIDKFVEGLPAGQRMNPEVYEYAYKQVLQQKQPEVLEYEVEKRADKIFEEKLQQYGLKVEGGNIVRNDGQVAVYGETGGIGPSGRPKKQVKVDPEEARRLQNIGVRLQDHYSTR